MKKTIHLIIFVLFSIFLISCSDNGSELPNKGKITLNYHEINITSDATSSTVLFASLEDLVGDIIWSSSDPLVAIVTPDTNPTAARVKGLKPGTVIIRVSVGEIFDECKITVSQGEFLTVPKTKIGLEIGKTEAINATAHISNITFSSSNESVATVTSSGLVTAISEGTSVVTVKAGNKTAYVTVLVEEAGVEIVEKNDVVLQLEDNPTATLTIFGKGGIDVSSGVWTIDDETVANITQDGTSLLIEGLQTGIGKTTIVRFNLNGYPEISRSVTVKDIDLELSLSPLTGTLLFNEESFELTASLTPTQEGERNKINWSANPTEAVFISDEGVITRNPEFVYDGDQVIVTVTAKSFVDPEATKSATIMVENPRKGIKFITDLDSFNRVMTSTNSNAQIYLEANIDLGGKVYSSAVMPSDFNGHFHGNGFTISNFTAPGIFGSVGGTVENLGITGTMTGSQRGFLAFHITPTATIRNLLIDVTFKSPAAYASGLGLLGKASNVVIIARNPNSLPTDQVYGGYVQGGTGTDVILHVAAGSVNTGGSGIQVKTEVQMKMIETFVKFDKTIWSFEEGKMPSLIVQELGEVE